MSEYLDLYHRTTAEAARAIIDSGRFRTRENTAEAYVSTHVEGQGTGYGEAVVQVRVDAGYAQLEDEFPDGEQHFRIPLDRARVVAAFTVAQDGARVPLTNAVRNTREASFPSPAPARGVIAGTDRPAAGAPRTRGSQLQR